MEVWLAGCMAQSPVRVAAAFFLDDDREPEAQARLAVVRRQSRQIDERVEIQALCARFDRDLRIEGLVVQRSALPVAAEGVGRPFARRRKVELGVRIAALATPEHPAQAPRSRYGATASSRHADAPAAGSSCPPRRRAARNAATACPPRFVSLLRRPRARPGSGNADAKPVPA